MTIEIGSVSPTSAIERIAAALEAAQAAAADTADATNVSIDTAGALDAAETRHPQAAETLARGGFAERILGETPATAASAPADLPGERADKNVETSTLQTHARPVAWPERPQTALHADAAVPVPAKGKDDFALPSALLVPAMLAGLQVEAAAGWPLTRRGFDAQPVAPLATAQSTDQIDVLARRQHDDDATDDGEEEATDGADDVPAQAEEPRSGHACPHVFEADGDDDWCEALTIVLREALASKIPPHALLLAAEQWQRGRCVVLACPQGFDAAGPAWAFVLWPNPLVPARGRAASPSQPARSQSAQARQLTLLGLRVDARLQWSVLPRGPKWCHVRVIKEHHPQRGRQLIPNTPGSTGAVPCEVQLGPVLARPLRCCEVCVRVHAAQRFWSALGQQWSMHVVVSSTPLLPTASGASMERSTEDSPC